MIATQPAMADSCSREPAFQSQRFLQSAPGRRRACLPLHDSMFCTICVTSATTMMPACLPSTPTLTRQSAQDTGCQPTRPPHSQASLLTSTKVASTATTTTTAAGVPSRSLRHRHETPASQDSQASQEGSTPQLSANRQLDSD